MTEPDTSIVFAGVDGRTDHALPTWYASQKAESTPLSFAEAVRVLPRAVETTVAYRNPYTDTWTPTDRFNAIVEPTRLAEQAQHEDDETDPLFHVPSQAYSIINPVDVFGPLETVLREETYDGQSLADIVFGEMRQYRGGGEVHMDILFDGLSVDLPGRNDPITVGVTSGYDFFGGHAVYVEGYAQDSYCANSIRSLTDRETVRHVGSVGDFEAWWRAILEQLAVVRDDLHEFIVDAQEITVDFTTVPFDPTEFYGLLGFPDYLATQAASDARSEATNPFDIDMWTLHSGATHALTHFYTGKEGVSLDQYVRTANDILFNPDATLRVVEETYKRQAEAETQSDGQTELESQVALAQVERVSEDVRSKASTFTDRETELRDRLHQTS